MPTILGRYECVETCSEWSYSRFLRDGWRWKKVRSALIGLKTRRGVNGRGRRSNCGASACQPYGQEGVALWTPVKLDQRATLTS